MGSVGDQGGAEGGRTVPAAAGLAAGAGAGRVAAAVATESWHTVEVGAAREILASTPDGLSDAEAAERLGTFGRNEIEAERETPWWQLALRQFRDPLIYILLVAAVVTAALRDYTDTGVILAVVLLNALIGFVQERRAQKAMRALARMGAPRADVVREGAARSIPAAELVPGDVVTMTSGSRVPADLRVAWLRDLEVDESALTGESAPVRKTTAALEHETLVPGDQTNMAFAGTVVVRGRARGIVVRTGPLTELGRIAGAVREIGDTATPLQRTMERFGRRIGAAVVVLSLLVAALGLARGLTPVEIFLAAVALAVSAIPEGLPVVLTVTLAIGIRRMARRNALIRSLPAVETLGSTTVIGSDKTGTLTKNEMTVGAVWAGGRDLVVTGTGYSAAGDVRDGDSPRSADDDAALRETILAGVVANEADPGGATEDPPRGDPTELALHVAAHKAGVDPAAVRASLPRLDEIPFEPELRYMATLVETPAGPRVYVKGAPEVVLGRCVSRLGSDGAQVALDADVVRSTAATLGARGLRVLALAYKDVGARTLGEGEAERDLVLAGLVGMKDPVRPEAIEAVAAARTAGIRVLMLTGDHVRTAESIGRELGLDPEGVGALEGHVVETMDDAELGDAVDRVEVYARVAPEHKLRIVEALKARGEVVAVTGDGVNDAPALRAAHLGVAMGLGGTDVAREAADMVLADDNFATITAAVEEGRIVFANIRKVTFFLLSTAVGEIITILVAVAAGLPLPFLAAQILWINLVTNGVQDVALAFEPGEPGLLQRRPRPQHEGILTTRLLERLGGVGVVLALGTLGVFVWSLRTTGDLEYARTLAMTQMVVFQFFHVFNCRSLDRSITSIPLLSNRFLFVSIVAAAAAHLAVLHVPALQAIFRTQPIGWPDWVVLGLVGSTVVLGGELDKWRNRRRDRLIG